MNHLLDTCAFLWLALQPERLSDRARAAMDDSDRLFLGTASLWEIVFKYAAGKLPLPDSPRAWLPARLAFFRVELLPMADEVVFLSGELPMVHRDPFDRLVAAEAIFRNLMVISPDAPIGELGARRLW